MRRMLLLLCAVATLDAAAQDRAQKLRVAAERRQDADAARDACTKTKGEARCEDEVLAARLADVALTEQLARARQDVEALSKRAADTTLSIAEREAAITSRRDIEEALEKLALTTTLAPAPPKPSEDPAAALRTALEAYDRAQRAYAQCATECVNLSDARNDARRAARESARAIRVAINELSEKLEKASAVEKEALTARRRTLDDALRAAARSGISPLPSEVAEPTEEDLVIERAYALEGDVSRYCYPPRPSAAADLAGRRMLCRDARNELAKVEQQLFKTAIADRAATLEIEERLKSGKLSDAEYAAERKRRRRLQERVQRVSDLLVLPDPSELFQALADFERFESRFYAGVEFANVNATFRSGHPRVGMLAQLRYGGTTVPEHHPDAGHAWRYGVFHFFNASLTNSAESIAYAADGTATPPAQPAEARQAFAFETALHWPLFRTSIFNRRLRNYIGPIVKFGARSIDEDPFADRRLYGGVRASISPEHYYEFLVGRTWSLDARRVEARGQIPVRRFTDTTRLLLGASGNFGIGGDRRFAGPGPAPTAGPERDFVTVYLAYNADFGKLFAHTFGN